VRRYGGARCLPMAEEFFVWDSSHIIELLLNDAALAEKVLLGYCLTHAEVLCDLHAQAAVITAPWYAPSSYGEAQRSIAAQPAKLHALRSRWQAGTFYPQYIQPLRDKLQILGRQMQKLASEPIGDIFNSLLHMSFNRAGMTPLKETWIRCWAFSCNGAMPQPPEDS
jgi:thiopeptide-type bacteriocin biosynthesis protein